MSESKCRSCGESSVIRDEDQIVCTACGHVQEDATEYQQDRAGEGYGQSCSFGSSYRATFATDNYRLRVKDPSHSRVAQKWTECIIRICEQMMVRRKDMQNEAVEIFKKAFKCNRFRLLQTSKKMALCASCVYIMCRQHGWPVLISQMSQFADTSTFYLKRLNRDLAQELDIKIDTLSIEDSVPTCLRNFGVTDERLIGKTVEVISLAVELCLSDGRHVTPLTIAACHLAWQASSPANHKKSLKKFEHAVLNKKVPPQVHLRLSELRESIRLMATRVPWISKAVLAKQNSWMFYLDDIVRYKKSLLTSLEPPEEGGDGDPEEEADVVLLEDARETFVRAPPSFKANERKRALEGDKPNETACKYTKSGHLTRQSMENPELSEKDIPDSELGLYIKTPEEVDMAKEMADIIETGSGPLY